MMKRMSALLLTLVMVLGLLTACGGGGTGGGAASDPAPAPEAEKDAPAQDADSGSAETEHLQIGLVLSGNANDGGWNQMAADAAQTVADKYGCTVNYTEAVKATDFESTIQGYAEAGYDIVVAHGAEFLDASKQVAKDYPETRFINTSAFSGQEPNLTGIDFGAFELGFLTGAACAYATEAKKIGVIIAVESDSMLLWAEGIKAAAKYIDDSIETVVVATGTFDDPIKAKQATDALAEQGCDVITQNADACGNGAVEECDTLGLINVGAVGDQSGFGESCFLTVVQDAHLGIETAISQAIEGTLQSGAVVMGANAGVIYLTDYTGKYADLLTDEEKASLQDFWQQAHDGVDLSTLVS